MMDDGRIIERGTHDSLMAARGVYHGVVMRQMESDTPELSPTWRYDGL